MDSPLDETHLPTVDSAGELARELAALTADPDWSPWPAPDVIASVDSTMTVMRDRANAGALAGTTIVADEQTAGRGRHGRAWQSPPGTGVWATVLLRPLNIAPDSLGLLPLLVGSKVARALSEWAAVGLWVKWPNDIVWSDIVWSETARSGIASAEGKPDAVPAKIAGVLAERLPDGAILVGIGVNVLAAPSGVGARALIDVAAQSHRVTRAGAAVRVLRALAQAAKAWERGDHDLTEYRHRCLTLGHRVSVTQIAGASWQGRAVEVTDAGLLLVEDDNHAVTAVSAGDVTLADYGDGSHLDGGHQ